MIIIKQGETYSKRFEFYDADTQEPIDLTSVTAYSEMRNKPGGTLAATGICNVDTENNNVTVTYSSAQTADIIAGQYGYDVWIVAFGEKHPIYTAEVHVVERYTEYLGG